MNNICSECGQKIEVMCFKGTGVDSELCRKARDRKKPKRASRKKVKKP